jgi:8-oxo-dGTP pyrophosphatase MutT (NUDIX family)
MMKRYVVGFLFTGDMERVVLIRKEKVRPGFEWMKGKVNGLGGMVKEGEDLIHAMTREFEEEAGVYIAPWEWKQCGLYTDSTTYSVQVFMARSDAALRVFTAAPEEGAVKHYAVSHIPHLKPVDSLAWVIPLVMAEKLMGFGVVELGGTTCSTT